MRIKKHRKQTGVSLIEVLISLLVIAIGVLGLAKMQALSIANAQVSGSRGLIALQASSLGALLHSNKACWQGNSTTTQAVCAIKCQGTTCTLSGSSTSLFGSATLASCDGTTGTSGCNGTSIASGEINTWMAGINAQVPSYQTILTCAGVPTTCTIEITWYEKQGGMNNTTASIAASTGSIQQAYFLYVQP